MDRAPNELLQPIIDELGTQVDDYTYRTALAGLRLMNHHLKKMATPYLFSTVSFWMSRKSTQALKAISEDNQL